MLEKYNTTIKPLNDELGRKLGIKQIKVQTESFTYLVPVYVSIRGKKMKSTDLHFYRHALGLAV